VKTIYSGLNISLVIDPKATTNLIVAVTKKKVVITFPETLEYNYTEPIIPGIIGKPINEIP